MNSVTEAESKNKKNQEIRSKSQRRARLCRASQVIKNFIFTLRGMRHH